MRLVRLLITVAALVSGAAAQAQAITPEQRQEFEQLIRDYLLKNPQVLTEAQQALQAREEAERAQRMQKALAEHRNALLHDPRVPVAGNPQGDVTVVEFFDYRCPHCKRSLATVNELVARDPKVRVVLREFPILGPESLAAARAALAAKRQGKYLEFHKALMADQASDAAAIQRIAAELKLDAARFAADMADPQLGEELDRNFELANALDIRGTPAFVVGDRIYPGAVDVESLGMMVGMERGRTQQVRNSK